MYDPSKGFLPVIAPVGSGANIEGTNVIRDTNEVLLVQSLEDQDEMERNLGQSMDDLDNPAAMWEWAEKRVNKLKLLKYSEECRDGVPYTFSEVTDETIGHSNRFNIHSNPYHSSDLNAHSHLTLYRS